MHRIIAYIHVIVIMAGSIFFTSCIRENLDDCPPARSSLRIYFSYDFDLISKALAGKDIENVHLYVFDKDDRFVLCKPEYNVQLDGNEYIDLELPPGTYNIVAWFNQGEHYRTNPDADGFSEGKTLRTDAQLYLDLPSGDSICTELPHLLYGGLSDVVVTGVTEHRYTIPVQQNTYRINLTVEGLPSTSDTYATVISDDNGRYNFDNSFAPCSEFRYKTTTLFGSNKQLNTSTVVLRLSDGRQPVLNFLNETSQENLFAGDLIALIKEANKYGASLDFKNTHEFDILLTFNADMSVTVTVNGWKYIPDETIIF